MNRPNAIRTAVVGAGLMGRWHAVAAERAGGRVVAIVDTDADAAQRLAKNYVDAQTAAEVGDVQVVHICTPLATHVELAERAIEAGRHLLIEKPLAPTATETERLLRRASERGVLLCPVHQFAFQDGVLAAREWLPRLGRLVHIESTFYSAGGEGCDGEQLDAIVADILPHPLSLMQMFLPGGLTENNWTSLRPGQGELRALGEINGVSLSIFISMNARPTVANFQITGTNATICLDLFHGYAWMESGRVSRARKIVHPFERAIKSFSAAAINLGRRTMRGETAYPGLQRLVRCFYQAVRQQLQPPISREATLAVARARDRLIR